MSKAGFVQKRHPSPKKLTVTVLSGGRESKTVSAPTHKERFNLIVLYNKKPPQSGGLEPDSSSNGFGLERRICCVSAL
jgi:hypothetical protein